MRVAGRVWESAGVLTKASGFEKATPGRTTTCPRLSLRIFLIMFG